MMMLITGSIGKFFQKQKNQKNKKTPKPQKTTKGTVVSLGSKEKEELDSNF